MQQEIKCTINKSRVFLLSYQAEGWHQKAYSNTRLFDQGASSMSSCQTAALPRLKAEPSKVEQSSPHMHMYAFFIRFQIHTEKPMCVVANKLCPISIGFKSYTGLKSEIILFSNTCVCEQLPLVLVFLGILAIRELQVYPVNEKKKRLKKHNGQTWFRRDRDILTFTL